MRPKKSCWLYQLCWALLRTLKIKVHLLCGKDTLSCRVTNKLVFSDKIKLYGKKAKYVNAKRRRTAPSCLWLIQKQNYLSKKQISIRQICTGPVLSHMFYKLRHLSPYASRGLPHAIVTVQLQQFSKLFHLKLQPSRRHVNTVKHTITGHQNSNTLSG